MVLAIETGVHGPPENLQEHERKHIYAQANSRERGHTHRHTSPRFWHLGALDSRFVHDQRLSTLRAPNHRSETAVPGRDQAMLEALAAPLSPVIGPTFIRDMTVEVPGWYWMPAGTSDWRWLGRNTRTAATRLADLREKRTPASRPADRG